MSGQPVSKDEVDAARILFDERGQEGAGGMSKPTFDRQLAERDALQAQNDQQAERIKELEAALAKETEALNAFESERDWLNDRLTKAEAELAEARELLGEIARGNGYGDHVACTHTRCDCAKIWNEKARAFLAAQDGGRKEQAG